MGGKILEENKKENPLYSDTAYDDAFRTMEGRCDDLLIPFVGHMFGEKFDKNAFVRRLRNEHFIEHQNGSEEKRTTDSLFEIISNGLAKRYHLECESSKYDGTILIRIFEYGAQIAKDTAEGDLYHAKLKFPNTGLLLLRASSDVPVNGVIEVAFPNGENVSYSVPIVKMSDYSIEYIFNEKLFMLIPFLIFNFENELPKLNKSEESLNEFIRMYNEIFDKLEDEQQAGTLSALSLSAIIKLTYSVAYKITMKQDNVQKKVGDVMGGKVLDLPEFRIYDQGKAEGKAEGSELKLIQMICRKMEKGKTIAIIAEELEEKEDEIKKIYDIALKYAPNYDSEQIHAELNKDKVSSN